ncbi:hypothetical protein [Pseudokineococcus sp. 1T1Z-3]|uniref:hypothetical protein n=1 Tax=Pseudokineococcus sp. 1T1Z-3 TaxID=3132745 RepID=UPI0030A9FD15
MTSTVSTPTVSTSTGRRRTSRLAAGAGALALAGVLAACGSGGDAGTDAGSSADPATAGPAVTLTLPATDGPAVACAAEVTPEAVADNDLAVEATAVDVADGVVRLDVVEDFAGGAGEQVDVPQPEADLPAELSPGVFEVGETYLVTADAGTVQACGQSGPVTPELRAVYEDAFSAR